MRIEGKKWSKSDKEFETRMNQYTIEDARKFLNKIDDDPDKEKRLEKQICKVCAYRVKGAFQAFTDTECGFCGTEMQFSNSNVDKLCKRCAIMNEACKHCGGEMD